jgi:molybdopterin synthase sulfur carrier subunit
MIKVLFFAQIREVLQCDSLEIQSAPTNLEELRNQLASKSELWAETIKGNSALAAVNQTISDNQVALKDGDEVAFFPPVTGG